LLLLLLLRSPLLLIMQTAAPANALSEQLPIALSKAWLSVQMV